MRAWTPGQQPTSCLIAHNPAAARSHGRRTRAAAACRAAHRGPEGGVDGTRRAAVAALAALPALLLAERRAAAAAGAPAEAPTEAPTEAAPAPGAEDVTDRVFLDVGVCEEGLRQDRRVGDKSVLCAAPAPLGRLELGLYGNAAPGTVAAFKAAAAGGLLDGTLFHKLLPGEYVLAGRQGPRRLGGVELPPPGAPGALPPNPDVTSSAAYRLRHARPGALSLAVGANDDDEYVRQGRDYRNVEFLITTGPAPAPYLDGENVVFGRVLGGGMAVVAAIAAVPRFYPDGNLRAYNALAGLLRDDRAARVRASWGRPLQPVVIIKAGVLE